MLSLIFIVLAHWNNSLRADMSLHSDTLFWFRANQSLLFLLNVVCLAEKQQIPILVWPDLGSNPRLNALEVSTLTIMPLILNEIQPISTNIILMEFCDCFFWFIYICIVIGEPIIIKWRPSWSWSYGSWIYNYLYNQCIFPLTFFEFESCLQMTTYMLHLW